jgi:hypothetical protein
MLASCGVGILLLNVETNMTMRIQRGFLVAAPAVPWSICAVCDPIGSAIGGSIVRVGNFGPSR